MNPDESIVLRKLTNLANSALAAGGNKESLDYQRLEREALADPDIVPAELREQIRTDLAELIKEREQAARDTSARIRQEWGQELEAIGNCLAFGELLHYRMERAFVENIDVLRDKEPRPHPEAATGAVLKCLLMLGLHARCFTIASEIYLLIGNGLSDGAQSRLRTLHEHSAVMTLIRNDHTYEVAERYQDHACFEELIRLKGMKRAYSDPAWKADPALDEWIVEEIAEVEAVAEEARSRWGRSIAEQYEWARPGLPADLRRNRRVTFADVEMAAEMDFLRGDYLTYNYQIHAGAHATIRSANFQDGHIYSTRPTFNSAALKAVAHDCINMFWFTSVMLSDAVARETEEFDVELYITEMGRYVNLAYSALQVENTAF